MRKKQTNQPNKQKDQTNHLSLEFGRLVGIMNGVYLESPDIWATLGYDHFLVCMQCFRFPTERKQKWSKIYGNQTGGCREEGGQTGRTSKTKSQLKTSHKPLIYWNTTYSLTSNYCKGYTVCSQQDGAEHCLHSRCLAIPEKEDFAYFKMSSIPKKKKREKKKEDLHSDKGPFNSLLW